MNQGTSQQQVMVLPTMDKVGLGAILLAYSVLLGATIGLGSVQKF
jgi:hypothetical protein